MQPKTRKALILAAAGLLAAACEPASQDVAPQRGVAVEAPVAPRHGDAPPGIAWFAGGVDAAFARATAEDKPVLLFWGAEWCPYCQDLKAHVFPRRDFREKLELFVPVYLDGDDGGAQKWGEEFGVAGYPTVLVLAADRTELARIAGGMDASVYSETLDLVLGDVRPLEEILASLASGATALSRDDCRRLAYNGWGLDDSATANSREIGAALADAAERCPGDARLERARLTAIAAAYTSRAGATEGDEAEGHTTPARLAALVHDVHEILADADLAVSIADALQYLGEEFFTAAERLEPERTAELRKRWYAAMDAVASDARYTEGDRLAAMRAKLSAAKALSANGTIPAELGAEARQRMEEALARVPEGPARAGLVNAAVNLLITLDDPARAYSIAEQAMSTAQTPYYYMADLAVLAEKMGRTEAAIDWFERAYRESQGPATRFQWGTNYVRGLIRLRPEDEAAIRAAAVAVLGELEGPDRIYRRTRARLDSLEASLRDWSTGGAHDEAIAAIRDRMSDICAGIPLAEQAALQSCRGFLTSGSG
jgi:thiol-disulfide isomerase/thioredoxin/5'-deoxynucleotidase YfbR-like HD superfamily hydrolase